MMICYSKGENPNLSPWRQGWQSRNHKLPKPNITFPPHGYGIAASSQMPPPRNDI